MEGAHEHGAQRRMRCKHWDRTATCSYGDACKFSHPPKICRNWPGCRYKRFCTFRHPPIEGREEDGEEEEEEEKKKGGAPYGSHARRRTSATTNSHEDEDLGLLNLQQLSLRHKSSTGAGPQVMTVTRKEEKRPDGTVIKTVVTQTVIMGAAAPRSHNRPQSSQVRDPPEHQRPRIPQVHRAPVAVNPPVRDQVPKAVTYKATTNFHNGGDETKLSINVGDIIKFLKAGNENWFFGECKGKSGYVAYSHTTKQ